MNWRLTGRLLGGLYLFLGATMLVPLAFALLVVDEAWSSFSIAALATCGVGATLWILLPGKGTLSHREGYALVTFGWLGFALLGAIPYVLTAPQLGLVEAFFESMSGFTTTGATVMTGLDARPHSILLWRSMTQWIGGMGIIVLGIAILPFLGVGGMQLYRFEAPGPTADRLRPRIEDTAKVLWGVYVALTILLAMLLATGGMSPFDATCHALTTMSTGGFSTMDASLAGFGSPFIHWVVTVFMVLAGVNFALHYAVLRGRVTRPFRSEETRAFLTLLVVGTLVVFLLILPSSGDAAVALREAAFQVVSLGTSTGYATADYELWPVATHVLLVLLMVVGGSSGSTSGGMKVVRVVVVAKHAWLQALRSVHPREVRVLKLDHALIPRDVTRGILGFFALYVLIFVGATFALALLGQDLTTSATAVIACLSNIGPGLGAVGPTDHYGSLPPVAQLVLGACMLMGRLEIFTVLVVLFPSFWRR